ncbi:pPIWI_RE_Z domain-containing protein [Streptosporangium vulgare]|uniref:pPIWI-RE three-gene island domain-containing protein n=1 Tax=Streptosporangium vulgare TaxID=46190 RepID=A0ABV5TEF4_9ACTN
MRDTESWYRHLVSDISGFWPQEHGGIKPSLLFQVELGLRLMERLDPERPADGVWVLLGGYPFARAGGLATTPDEERLLVSARHLLWTLRRRRMWLQSLETYRELPERLRGYRLPSPGDPARRAEPFVATGRFATYDAELRSMPGFARRELPLASPGSHRFVERRRITSVTLPESLRPAPAPGHGLAAGDTRKERPLHVPLAELADTARWMDDTERQVGRPPGDWERRLAALSLDTRTDDGRGFAPAEVLGLDGLLHLVGMVGAGKSTLMSLIAVWAAGRGMRTTLVVGDVAEQLTLTALFRELGLAAAPVLGTTTRETHVQRLHRRLAARAPGSLLTHDHPGFDDLSTVCVVDALRGNEAVEPLRYADAPCTGLHPARKTSDPAANRTLPGPDPIGEPVRSEEPPDRLGRAHGCPIWSACPRHSAARELVDALIWVANPASLVQSPVPNHLNEERLRYLELACLRSDIMIVDEADRVQMQLDTMFAPSATLVTRGPESWLDKLHTHKIDELARQGRLPLSERDVERWAVSLDVVSVATNRLYAMLMSDEDLRTWADIEYFSAWTLQEKLIADWYPAPGETSPNTPAVPGLADDMPDETILYEDDERLAHHETASRPASREASPQAGRRQEVTAVLDTFRDDPLGDRGPYGTDADRLVQATHDLLHTLNENGTRQRVRGVLDLLLKGSPLLDGSLPPPARRHTGEPDPADVPGSVPWYDRTTKRLEFSLLLAALHQRLDRLTFLWPQVEAALNLDSTDNELSRRPPLDYAPIVPEAPMGNVIGFQYLPEEQDRDPEGRRSGTLRFFRCAGVGRELLLSLPSLGAVPSTGHPGPHVLLMSGTSWAGTSTRAHVLAPVKAVLKPDPHALEAIRDTVFRTHFLYDDGNTPLSLSGQDQTVRPAVLRQMITRLGRPGRGGLPSPLEQELALIGDDSRRRALLLVGSYREANAAADMLQEMERWRGRVRVLAADDADLEQAVRGGGLGSDGRVHAAAVRRGDLASFAEDPDAEVLVAPLMAIERGHNILNAQRTAAFGTVLFLARPHPRPDDLSLSIFAINDWVARFVRDHPDLEGATFGDLVAKAESLDAAGLAFRHEARREWRRLLSRRYVYSRLAPAEKRSFAWDQLVAIWQVIGRLVRGGVPARVVFVDARFAPRYAVATAPGADTARTARLSGPGDGLLAELRAVLAPYFDVGTSPGLFADPADPALVQMLYRPLYDALCGMTAGPGRP